MRSCGDYSSRTHAFRRNALRPTNGAPNVRHIVAKPADARRAAHRRSRPCLVRKPAPARGWAASRLGRSKAAESACDGRPGEKVKVSLLRAWRRRNCRSGSEASILGQAQQEQSGVLPALRTNGVQFGTQDRRWPGNWLFGVQPLAQDSQERTDQPKWL